MSGEKMCPETQGGGGRPLSCQQAYADGCRCSDCVRWRYGQEDAAGLPAPDDNPANRPRNESGQFKSTALSRSVRSAVDQAGGDEALYGFVEAGLSASEILAVLGLESSERGTWVVYRLLNSDPERYKEAKKISADALAERAFELYGEDTPETSADAKWRNDRAGHMRWLAEMRSGFGKDGVNVNLDVGALYLDVLREHGRMEKSPDRPSRSEPVDAEFEIQD